MKIKILSLAFLLFAAGCNKDLPVDNNDENNNPVSGYKLELIKEHPMDVKEPSGLSWDLKHQNLLTVSDNTNKAYSVDTQGKTLHTFIYEGDDTEGITIDEKNGNYWIAEEAKSQLVKVDSTGIELQRYYINVNPSSKKKGLEGLSYDGESKIFYILNEAEPGLLVKWSLTKGIISKKELNFASDYSGIYYDKDLKSLWIVSDQSQKLFLCNTDGVVKQSFALSYEKAEGVVADIKSQRLFIVSDSEQKLYEYKITEL
jgi:uncharacterized protein YjiK